MISTQIYSKKLLQKEVLIQITRDCDVPFNSQIISKHKYEISTMEDKAIDKYSHGMCQ